jgi:hypothetical protein
MTQPRRAIRGRIPPSLLAFLIVEVAAFAGASLTHFGVLMQGYEHTQAGIAEAVIAAALATAIVIGLLRPAMSRVLGLAAQGFALLGTSVGVFSMVRGFGPRSVADLAFHVGIATILVAGLVVAFRLPERDERRLDGGR